MIFKNYSLKKYNTFNIDIKAKWFVVVKNVGDILNILADQRFLSERKMILGGGSNVLFTRDFNGLVILVKIKGIKKTEEDNDSILLKVGAGEVFDNFVEYCVNKNLGGLENLSSIYGSVGAAPIQNIGAYGQEIKDVIDRVETINIDTKKREILDNNDCKFCYRDSIFKDKEFKGKYIITDVYFRLKKDPKSFNIDYEAISKELRGLKLNLKNIRNVIIKIRDEKLPNPKEIGNAGSFFKNIKINKEDLKKLEKEYPELKGAPHINIKGKIKIPTAWLIDQCGFKGKGKKQGKSFGAYGKQPLILVNYGKANGKDILDFSKEIQKQVFQKFGVKIKREVNIY